MKMHHEEYRGIELNIPKWLALLMLCLATLFGIIMIQ